MPEKSGFFDHTEDDPREYPAREWAEYFGTLITNGVLNGGLNLNVSATGTDANVSISTGIAWIKGYRYSIYDSPLVLPIQPATTQDRIDRIVLRLDTSIAVKRIRALIVQGTPSANPTAPSIVRSGDVFDLSLAQVRVKANSTIILPANITDERLNQSVCGLMNSLIKVDTATFQQQWDAFIASVQNQGFATPSYVNQRVSLGNFSPTSNVGNAYSATFNPAQTELKAGMEYKVLINADSTGAPTFNPDRLGAHPVLKANQSPAIFKKNGIYTVVFNGTSAFILQGEGGEYGTVVPAAVLTGWTFGSDDGPVNGTMSNRGALDVVVTSIEGNPIPTGYHNGSGKAKVNITAGNTIIYSNSENVGVAKYDWSVSDLKSVQVSHAGSYRVTFNVSHNSYGSGYNVQIGVFVNGILVFTGDGPSMSWTTHQTDRSLQAGDVVSLRGRSLSTNEQLNASNNRFEISINAIVPTITKIK